MTRFSIIAAAAALLGAVPAAAQDTVRTAPGEEVRVGWIGSVGAGCRPNPAPSISPAKVADHGQIRLTQGEVTTNSVPDCPGIKVPAIVVFYTSSPDFTGTDAFTLTVEGDGQASERSYTIVVE